MHVAIGVPTAGSVQRPFRFTPVRRTEIGGFVWILVAAKLGWAAPVPLADRPQQALLPSWISEQPLKLNGQRAYLFPDEDGSEVVHLVGEFVGTLGETEGQQWTSREAVLWVSHRTWNGRPYRHVEMFLYREAQIREIAGTWTSGPALLVSFDTVGKLSTEVDEFTFQSSAETPAYRDGSKVRRILAEAGHLDSENGQMPWRVFDPTGLGKDSAQPKPRPAIQFQSQGEFRGPIVHNGEQVVTVIGRVFLSRGGPGTADYLNVQADSAVVFLSGDAAVPIDTVEDPLGGQPRESTQAAAPDPNPSKSSPERRRPRRDSAVLSAGFADLAVEGAYLEGDVLMTVGPNMVRASRLYYDFLQDRALILDAVVRTVIPERNIPLYLRAAEIRQLSTRRFAASDAILTTSEFRTPHYHIGARQVEVTNQTLPGPSGRTPGLQSGSFRIQDATLNVSNVPIAWWPSVQGTVDTSETALKSLRVGYSGDFGVELETEWNLFSLLDLEEPKGFDTTLSLDYFSDRGPAAGVDATYERDNYFGLFRSYIIADDGTDSLGNDRDVPPPNDLRGRVLVRHRDYLSDDWQLTLEASYISDRNFLKEFFEPEFENEKEQETLLSLKKQRDNWAFVATLQSRILDFTTTTERLPDFAYYRIAEPLGTASTWYTENRLGLVRYRPADQTLQEFLRDGSMDSSATTFRADTRQELTVPLDLGPWRWAPFTAVRGSAWSDSIDGDALARAFAGYGVRGNMILSRVYEDTRSALLDIDGLRHLIKPEVTAWASHTNVDSDELYPFDETVEGIDEVDGVSFGVRQRWQTHRGEGPYRRNVDVFTLDAEVAAFNDGENDEITNGYTSTSRPENSISHNYLNNSFIWRINDRTALLQEMNYDINDGEVDVFNVALAVERTPRFGYVLGYRMIEESSSELLGFDINYRLNEKHTLAVREAFDLDRGQTLDFTVAVIRKHPRWFTAWSFELDEAEDDFGISFSLWPEGLQQAALGSRRFTSLANSTRIGGQ